MFPAHVDQLCRALEPSDVVLDIGGWACPFNRATHVLDAMPYESRGFYRTFGAPAFQGPEREHFTPATWIVRDICDHTPYPFADGEVDFVVCSHTLEDIRDPIWVVQEMARIAKRGYVEVPSRVWETVRDVEDAGMVGLLHHRWLIEADGAHLRFIPKWHVIHADPRYSLPWSYGRRLGERDKVLAVWWSHETGGLSAEEVWPENARDELAAFVRRHREPPLRERAWHAVADRITPLVRRVRGGVARRLWPAVD